MATATKRKRESTLGRWRLPTKAITGLLENGIDETNILDFEIEDLMELKGFGNMAAQMHRTQRAQFIASKKRGAVTREENRAEAKSTENALDFLKLPGGGPIASKTAKTVGKRLILDIGPEHGLGGRHAEWMERIIKIMPKEMGIDSLERLVVFLVRGAMANDPSKGGIHSVDEVTGEGIEKNFSPTIRV